MTATRAQIDELHREGMADAAVLLVAHRVLPRYELADWGKLLGLDHADLVHAVNRFKDRARPKTAATGKKQAQPGEHKCDHPGCTVSYADRRGLTMHRLAHQTAGCDLCGRTFNAAGLRRHRAACNGPAT